MTRSVSEIGLRVADKLTDAIVTKPGRNVTDEVAKAIQYKLRFAARLGDGTIPTGIIRDERDFVNAGSK